MSVIQANAIQNTILSLLAATETNYEYPGLQGEAIDIIATNISNSIYTTVQQKSTASYTKRRKVLKLLNNICQTSEFHLVEDNYKIYLKGYEREFYKTDCSEAENLSDSIGRELDQLSLDLHSQIVNFYKRKNVRSKDKRNKLELIKQFDEDKLNGKLGVHLLRNVSHYEISGNLIDNLLINTSIPFQKHKKNCRNKQVQFCYALINIGDKSDMKILQNILQKYSTYDIMESSEIKLMMDLWLLEDPLHVNLSRFIFDNFPFVLDKLVIQFCKEIIWLKNRSEIDKYFSGLSINPKIVRLQDICAKNLNLYCKLKCLIFELYVFSYCNINVLMFSNYII